MIDRERIPQLTDREKDILLRRAEGQTNKEIAGELGLSVGTIKNHSHNILYKLGAVSMTQVVYAAAKGGFL